jgi:hypothetical protein
VEKCAGAPNLTRIDAMRENKFDKERWSEEMCWFLKPNKDRCNEGK